MFGLNELINRKQNVSSASHTICINISKDDIKFLKDENKNKQWNYKKCTKEKRI